MMKLIKIIKTGLAVFFLSAGYAFSADPLTIEQDGNPDHDQELSWWVNMHCDIDPVVRQEVPDVPVYTWTAKPSTIIGYSAGCTNTGDNKAKLTVSGTTKACSISATVTVTVPLKDTTKKPLSATKPFYFI